MNINENDIRKIIFSIEKKYHLFEFQINKESFGAEDESTSTAAFTVIVPLISVDRTTADAATPACVTLTTLGVPAAACTTTFAITWLPLV